jgi:sigma-B regulation protein RsbU (phosphoserine phosphatase)
MKNALLGTLPGRAIVIGVAIKAAVIAAGLLAGGVPAFVNLVDTMASIAIAVGGGYFLVRGLVSARRRLLWRVRRKLIISYILIGFIPAILIAAFFLLGGLLLFFNFSSYLVQARLRTMGDRAHALAVTTAEEIQRAIPIDGDRVLAILTAREEAARREFLDVSMAVVRVERPCEGATADTPPPGAIGSIATAGAWAHVEPPVVIPAWIDCAGFSGLLVYANEDAVRRPNDPTIVVDGREMPPAAGTHLLVRAVAFPESIEPSYALVVDLPIGDEVRRQLRRDTGVELSSFRIVNSDATWLPAREGASAAAAPSDQSAPLTSVSILEYHDWTSNRAGRLVATMQLSIGEIYQKISAAQGLIGNRSFGEGLLLVLIVIGALFLIIEAVALATGLSLARSITGSVHELFEGTERVRQGDFTHKIAVKANDQLGELAQSFNSMTASIEDLLLQAAEKKRLEEELRIARQIQMSLLPQDPIVMPGLSVTAVCVPAREVGGDYYDFFQLGDDQLGVLIADVSGKGTSAAFYMAELKGLLLSLSRIHISPRELMIEANRIIAAHLDARSFITMTYAVIDLRARTMTYARAGHTPLMYLPGPSEVEGPGLRVLAPDGLVLGLKIDNGELFERLLQEETIALHDGDLCLFFTDGISEAMNAADDCFGETRLGRLLTENADLPSDLLRERVLDEIAQFVGAAPQHDDMTMILLKIEDVGAITAITTETASLDKLGMPRARRGAEIAEVK